MVRLTVLTLSSLLALSALPVHAQTTGDVLQGIGRAMNGEPNRPPDWRDRERERPIGTSSAVSTPSSATSMRAAAHWVTSGVTRRGTGITVTVSTGPPAE